MRAIPSPTLSTVPISLTCASVPKLAIWSLMTLEISAALMSIFLPFLGSLAGPQPFIAWASEFKRVAKRAIDHLAAHLDDEAAHDGGIDSEIEGHVAAGARLQLPGERGLLRLAQREGRRDFGARLAAMGREQSPEGANDVGKLRKAAIMRQHAKRLGGEAVELQRRSDGGNGPGGGFAADQRTLGQCLELLRFAERGLEGGEAFRHRIEGPFDAACGVAQDRLAVTGQLEQCERIAPRQASLNTAGILHARLTLMVVWMCVETGDSGTRAPFARGGRLAGAAG